MSLACISKSAIKTRGFRNARTIRMVHETSLLNYSGERKKKKKRFKKPRSKLPKTLPPPNAGYGAVRGRGAGTGLRAHGAGQRSPARWLRAVGRTLQQGHKVCEVGFLSLSLHSPICSSV